MDQSEGYSSFQDAESGGWPKSKVVRRLRGVLVWRDLVTNVRCVICINACQLRSRQSQESCCCCCSVAASSFWRTCIFEFEKGAGGGCDTCTMAPKGRGSPTALGPPRSFPPPGAKGGLTRQGTKSLAAGAAAGAAGASAAVAISIPADEDSDEESEAESESEEAQVCWGAVFSFLPVIIEIVMEFSSAAAEAVRAQRAASVRHRGLSGFSQCTATHPARSSSDLGASPLPAVSHLPPHSAATAPCRI